MLIDVGQELADHFTVVKELRDKCVADVDDSGASKAAILNATTAIIRELAKIQTELYNSALIANIQASIIEGLEEADQAFKDKVVKILERRLENL